MSISTVERGLGSLEEHGSKRGVSIFHNNQRLKRMSCKTMKMYTLLYIIIKTHKIKQSFYSMSYVERKK